MPAGLRPAPSELATAMRGVPREEARKTGVREKKGATRRRDTMGDDDIRIWWGWVGKEERGVPVRLAAFDPPLDFGSGGRMTTVVGTEHAHRSGYRMPLNEKTCRT